MSYRSYRSYQNLGARAVWTLILANVVIFLAVTLTRNSSSVFEAFGISRDYLDTQPWTMLTSMFLHAGFTHILFNMLWLYWYGTALVQLIGEIKFLILYFVGGLVGNALFVLIEPDGLGIGASGAVLALGGALAIMRPKMKIVLFPIPIPMDLWVYVLIGSAFLGVLIPAISGGSGIGWQAHLGGLVTGLAFGWYFRRWERRRGIYR
ncbi:MAG: rhomboid family intramembrane serine protease [Dehalococcoidales bacterium]|nr:rhomboid family intramembrane serine protease [Dehalococcoidales bacterium]